MEPIGLCNSIHDVVSRQQTLEGSCNPESKSRWVGEKPRGHWAAGERAKGDELHVNVKFYNNRWHECVPRARKCKKPTCKPLSAICGCT